MAIKDELNDELKTAMRTHDRNRIDVVRPAAKLKGSAAEGSSSGRLWVVGGGGGGVAR